MKTPVGEIPEGVDPVLWTNTLINEEYALRLSSGHC